MITQTTYKNFGNCVEFNNGKIKALVTTDIGPRIIFYGTAGGKNIFFEDTERAVSNGGGYFDKTFRTGERWNIYGGHRLWKSPEEDATYVPDNYPVEYSVEKNFAEFLQPIQPNTRLRFGMRVEMSESGGLTVTHTVTNFGSYTVNLSVWAITVLKAGGKATFPLNTNDTGFLPNNFISYWPYNDLNDSRLLRDEAKKALVLSQDPNAARAFKIGLLLKKGEASYTADGMTFAKKFGYRNGAVYPDNGCNFEAYTSNLILEMEGLSPVYAVEPNTSVTHVEKFELTF
ncbi:MAG: hypothetical protein LBT20_05835 [Clostridiales bacterium]|nr:hypothetical protein [Clostridiales bacterium]